MTTAFAILSPVIKERLLTEALRYFLDSNGAHGLGDRLFRALSSKLELEWKLPRTPLSVTAISEWPTDGGRKVDVVAVVRKSWRDAPLLVVGIEAKIGAPESKRQIADYQKALRDAYPEVEKRLIYLTLSGHDPKSAKGGRLGQECPTKSVAWRDIAEMVGAVSPKLRVAGEFADYLNLLVTRNEGAVATAIKFVEKGVLPSVRQRLGLKEAGLPLAWNDPKDLPDEFNFYCWEKTDRLKIVWMLHSPAGVPMVGRQVYLLLMAIRSDKKEDARNLDTLRKSLPPREGPQFEWGPWKFLWSGGARTLKDMGNDDMNALVEMMTRAHKSIDPVLQKGLRDLWPA